MRFGRFWIDADLWLRTWVAVQRLLAAGIILVLHDLYQQGVKLLFPTALMRVQLVLDVVESVMVVAITAALLVEAVRIFLPKPWGIDLNPGEKRTIAKHRVK